MSDNKVILVTGVSGYWGSLIAEKLIELNENINAQSEETESAELPGFHVIGLDGEPPIEPIKGLDFIRADVRNPLLVELLQSEHVHTIIHLAFWDAYRPSEKTFDLNVIGTMKVIGAASEAGVRKVILRSSTAVYGAHPTNPAFLSENHPLNGSKTNGVVRNLVEIEAFVNGFRRQAPEMIVTMLRFANIVGPTVDSPMTRFLKQNPPLILFGFDPLMQVIHEEDVVQALIFAALNDIPGVFNIAAEGILPLGKILGLAGRLPLPVIHPFAYWGAAALKTTGLRSQRCFPLEPDYIRYPWIADLARMREEIGFLPTYTSEEALREFSGQLRLMKYKPDNLDMAYDEERLHDTIERRKRVREMPPRPFTGEQGGDL